MLLHVVMLCIAPDSSSSLHYSTYLVKIHFYKKKGENEKCKRESIEKKPMLAIIEKKQKRSIIAYICDSLTLSLYINNIKIHITKRNVCKRSFSFALLLLFMIIIIIIFIPVIIIIIIVCIHLYFCYFYFFLHASQLLANTTRPSTSTQQQQGRYILIECSRVLSLFLVLILFLSLVWFDC